MTNHLIPDASERIAPCPFCGKHAGATYQRGAFKVIVCDSCGGEGPCTSINGSASEAAKLWNRRAAAQVGANGAADIPTWQEQWAKEYPTQAKTDMAVWAKLKCACNEITALRSRLAAGAPADTPKPDERIAFAEIALGKALLALFVHDPERVSAISEEYNVRSAGFEMPDAATIGAGEGKDALDAARFRTMADYHIDMIYLDDMQIIDVGGKYSGDLRKAIDAMRSKTSPGEAG